MIAILVGIAILANFCAILCLIGRPRPGEASEERERVNRQLLNMSYDTRVFPDLTEQDRAHGEQVRRSPPKYPRS